jgi:hypothetical protein
MGMAIESFSDGLMTVKVSGQLTAAQWQAGQAAAVARMSEWPAKVSVLVTAEDFRGWDRDTWDESPYQSQFNARVDRLAIVGQPEWEALTLMFVGKGLRRMEIEYFATADVGTAREWLKSKA